MINLHSKLISDYTKPNTLKTVGYSMADRHSKRSSIALWIAIAALLISLVNLYLATELPEVNQ